MRQGFLGRPCPRIYDDLIHRQRPYDIHGPGRRRPRVRSQSSVGALDSPSTDIGQPVRFIGTAGLISAASTGTLLLYFAVSPLRRAISTQAVSRGVSQFLRDPLGWYMGQSVRSSENLSTLPNVLSRCWSLSVHASQRLLPGQRFRPQSRLGQIQRALARTCLHCPGRHHRIWRRRSAPHLNFTLGYLLSDLLGDRLVSAGCALFSLLISLHTFVVLFLRKTPPRWACALVIAFSWLLILFITLVGPAIIAPATGKGDFYGNSGAWCWISINYQVSLRVS